METLKKIAEMANGKHWREVIDNFILPEVLKRGGSPRNYQISDEYMTVVAEFAPLVWAEDKEAAELLLEFAMQRISCGAVKHSDMGSALNVPQRYVYYSTFQDKPALMSKACWDFMERAFSYALVSDKLKKHAKAILFGLIFNLDYKSGRPLNSYDLGELSDSAKEVKDFVWRLALEILPFDEFWKKLVSDGWIKYKSFFDANWDKIDINEFHKTLIYYVPAQKAWRDLVLDGWERHIAFFHNNWNAVDDAEFYKMVGAKNLIQKAKIIMKIRTYSV